MGKQEMKESGSLSEGEKEDSSIVPKELKLQQDSPKSSRTDRKDSKLISEGTMATSQEEVKA